MSNTNFIKINNEYVKFFASTNTALPKILQNTGALIVVQDDAKWDKNSYINDNSYMRSLWLAYNFIAEGHGFLEEDVRDFYAYYGERVKSSDGSSYMYRLAYELGNLDVHIDNVEEALSLYVLTKGGNISYTYINTYVYGSSEPTSLLATDFTKLLKPADYEDITITDFDSYIYYNYDNGHNGRKAVTKQYLSYATNIDELNFNDDSKIRCINYDIPRGAQITEVHSNYKTINGSTNGFELDSLTLNETLYIDNDIELEESNNYIHVITDLDIIGMGETTYNSNIAIAAHTAGTVKYKPYPNYNDDNFISYENIIPKYTKVLGYITYTVYDTVKYTFNDNTSIPSYKIYSDEMTRIYNFDNNYSYAKIDCGENENSYLMISIPSNYEIQHVYQNRNYIRNGRNAVYEYNISGDTFELSYMNTRAISYVSPIRANLKINYNCKNYVITNPIENNDSIYIYFKKKDIDPINKSLYIDYTEQTTIKSNITGYFLQDSEYNSNHWMSTIDLSYIQQVI